MTTINLTMPQPGETITQGMVVRWLKKPGDAVSEGEIVVELETEKAVFEYESPYAGVLKEILVGENTSAPVGTPIAIYEVDEVKAKSYKMLGMGTNLAKSADSDLVGAERAVPPPTARHQGNRRTVPLSPYVRAQARTHGLSEVDLAGILGTGPRGRVTKEDILSLVNDPGRGTLQRASTIMCASAIPISSVPMDRIPCSPIRIRIAENMVLSKQNVPHAHTGLSVDMTALVTYREKNRKNFEKKNGIDLGFLPLMLPTLKNAIRAFPVVNAQYLASDKQIGLFKHVNLGVAIDTERGLYTPVVPHVEDLSYLEFARQLEAVLDRASKNKLTHSDLTGMTFTFNNFGFFGTTLGIQVVPPNQSTILGMGRIEKKPWVVGDKIKVRYVAEFVMAFDHRVLDGRDAGLFLHAIKKSLENFLAVDLVG